MNWLIPPAASPLLLVGALMAMSHLHADELDVLDCPSGAQSPCAPSLVGSVVLCREGEIQGYESVSRFCLSCHADERPMAFDHPHDIRYPAARREFRQPDDLQQGITFNAGFLTCKTCHSGTSAANHFLFSNSGVLNLCGNCHLTGIECPEKPKDPRSRCFPGRLNGLVRCVHGGRVVILAHSSDFCLGCHGGADFRSRSHPVEIDYPRGRKGFTPIGDLDPAIKLEDGRITCESCHNAAGLGFALCVKCHRK